MQFETITDTQGRLIAALSIPELEALQTRCDTHKSECEQREIVVKPQIAMMCAAVKYFLEDSKRGPIAAAFRRFSELRQQCIVLGFAPPPIVGTPAVHKINGACVVMEQAIAASEPLPGEPPELTQRINSQYKQAIKNAVDFANEK